MYSDHLGENNRNSRQDDDTVGFWGNLDEKEHRWMLVCVPFLCADPRIGVEKRPFVLQQRANIESFTTNLIGEREI